ncbi:MAG: metallophosphoesterase family protein [bacterium]|jgi:predicted MPP superfamily phosphohydrolase
MKRKELSIILCAVAGALLFLFIAVPTTDHQLAAFRFSLSLTPGSGLTKMELPPVGSVGAKTHLAPWNLVLTLKSVDFDGLQQLINTPGSKDALIATLFSLKWKLLSRFAIKMTLIAALGGAFGSLWIRRSRRDFLYGLSSGIAVVFIMVLVTSATYDLHGFSSPVYNGALKGAPWALGLAQNAWEDWNDLGGNVRVFVQNLRQVMAKTNSQLPPEKLENDFKVLHVSDLHNNPLAIDFISEINNNFIPDLIIDTGDLTDFGTTVEDTVLKHLTDLETPYYLVLGNHDSPIIAEKVADMTGVTLLEGIEEVNNIKIMGIRDPGSLTHNLTPASSDQISAQVDIIQGWLQSMNQAPFILAVHNPAIAEHFVGEIPVILTGHTHTSRIDISTGTVLINAGTTGGAGVRGLLREKEVALTAALLYIDTSGLTPVLDAVDIICLYPRENRFELTRTAIS